MEWTTSVEGIRIRVAGAIEMTVSARCTGGPSKVTIAPRLVMITHLVKVKRKKELFWKSVARRAHTQMTYAFAE